MSSGSESSVLELELELEEDIPETLEEFVKLSRTGKWAAAQAYFDDNLRHHVKLFPVAAEYADHLILQGALRQAESFLETVLLPNLDVSEGGDDDFALSETERSLLELRLARIQISTKGKLRPALQQARNARRFVTGVFSDYLQVSLISDVHIQILIEYLSILSFTSINSTWLLDEDLACLIADTKSGVWEEFAIWIENLIVACRFWETQDLLKNVAPFLSHDHLSRFVFKLFTRIAEPQFSSSIASWCAHSEMLYTYANILISRALERSKPVLLDRVTAMCNDFTFERPLAAVYLEKDRAEYLSEIIALKLNIAYVILDGSGDDLPRDCDHCLRYSDMLVETIESQNYRLYHELLCYVPLLGYHEKLPQIIEDPYSQLQLFVYYHILQRKHGRSLSYDQSYLKTSELAQSILSQPVANVSTEYFYIPLLHWRLLAWVTNSNFQDLPWLEDVSPSSRLLDPDTPEAKMLRIQSQHRFQTAERGEPFGPFSTNYRLDGHQSMKDPNSLIAVLNESESEFIEELIPRFSSAAFTEDVLLVAARSQHSISLQLILQYHHILDLPEAVNEAAVWNRHHSGAFDAILEYSTQMNIRGVEKTAESFLNDCLQIGDKDLFFQSKILRLILANSHEFLIQSKNILLLSRSSEIFETDVITNSVLDVALRTDDDVNFLVLLNRVKHLRLRPQLLAVAVTKGLRVTDAILEHDPGLVITPNVLISAVRGGRVDILSMLQQRTGVFQISDDMVVAAIQSPISYDMLMMLLKKQDHDRSVQTDQPVARAFASQTRFLIEAINCGSRPTWLLVIGRVSRAAITEEVIIAAVSSENVEILTRVLDKKGPDLVVTRNVLGEAMSLISTKMAAILLVRSLKSLEAVVLVIEVIYLQGMSQSRRNALFAECARIVPEKSAKILESLRRSYLPRKKESGRIQRADMTKEEISQEEKVQEMLIYQKSISRWYHA